MKKLIVGNWKMNPTTRDEARRLSSDIKRGAVKIKNANIAVCPPFVFARDAMEIFDGGKILVCAQDIFWRRVGRIQVKYPV